MKTTNTNKVGLFAKLLRRVDTGPLPKNNEIQYARDLHYWNTSRRLRRKVEKINPRMAKCIYGESAKYDAVKLCDMGYGDISGGEDVIHLTPNEVADLAQCVGGSVAEIERARII